MNPINWTLDNSSGMKRICQLAGLSCARAAHTPATINTAQKPKMAMAGRKIASEGEGG